MIGRLAGKLLAKHPPQVMVECSGVAYEVDVPMSTFYNLPAIGEAVSLYTHLVVREDAHTLYGFATLDERAAFRQLIRISGIGARTALSVLSGLSVGDLANAITMQDAAALTRIPGIGKKTAERLLLELKGKLAETAAPAGALPISWYISCAPGRSPSGSRRPPTSSKPWARRSKSLTGVFRRRVSQRLRCSSCAFTSTAWRPSGV